MSVTTTGHNRTPHVHRAHRGVNKNKLAFTEERASGQSSRAWFGLFDTQVSGCLRLLMGLKAAFITGVGVLRPRCGSSV